MMALPIPKVRAEDDFQFIYANDNLNGPTNTFVIPATARKGDLAIVLTAKSNQSSTPGQVVPTGFSVGWSRPYTRGALPSRDSMYFKILTAADIGPTFNCESGQYNAGALLIFRKDFSGAAIGAGPNTADSGGDPASQTVNTTGLTGKTLMFCCSYMETVAGWQVQTPAFQIDRTVIIGNNAYQYRLGISYYERNPPSQIVDVGDTGTSTTLGSCAISLT